MATRSKAPKMLLMKIDAVKEITISVVDIEVKITLNIGYPENLN
jgi:hypothetical protein